MGRSVYVLKDRMAWALGASLLFHLLFLLFTGRDAFLLFRAPESRMEEEKRIAFEIIETPETGGREIPPEEADLLSDKNSRAADAMTDRTRPGLEPFSEGFHPLRSVPGQRPVSPAPGPPRRARKSARSLPEDAEFSRDVLVASPMASGETARPAYRQTASNAQSFGSIRFNTYAWDFAPYLIYLKNRISKNIYPPPVFTHMGFGGTNHLRFRILPDGRLVGPQMLEYEGERALVETSAMAVRVSAPFRPLPDEFPEEFLEVTATFYYVGIPRN